MGSGELRRSRPLSTDPIQADTRSLSAVTEAAEIQDLTGFKVFPVRIWV